MATRSWRTGDAVMVETNWGESLEGRVWAVDERLGLLVLQRPSPRQQLDFSLFPLAELTVLAAKSVDPAGPLQSMSLAMLAPLDEAAARRREADTVQKARVAASKVGRGVSREAQELFNAIESLYPSPRWDGTSIVVLGAVAVAAPYTHATTLARPGGADPAPAADLQRLVQNICGRSATPEQRR